MITIGTIKFDFQADDESFARKLNGRWDTFFSSSFEKVVEEVLSRYDSDERVITIESLPIDLGRMTEEEFDHQFPRRLRDVLTQYCKKRFEDHTTRDEGLGVRMMSTGRNAFDVLSFFLLHGYLPFSTEAEYTDIDFLLEKVIGEESSRFREFLESYGHYDFLCKRLIFQFSDQQLEQIVHVVQPSESKFINLYVRVQIRAYDLLKKSDVTRDDYRTVVWTLVLAYLFAESGGRFNRKQIIMHTIRGIAAHFNLYFAEVIRLLTEGIQELERGVEQLPELWSLLKEIRQDVKSELWALDGNYQTHLIHEVVGSLRLDETRDTQLLLSREHMVQIFANPALCRKLLQQLQEREIYLLVGVVIPQEKEYVISYAQMLDKHRDAGVFEGKAGSEFRMLKWEFIFAVLIVVPVSQFSRKQFVLSTLQRLAAHYNLSVTELIRLFSADEGLKMTSLPRGLLSVLQELSQELTYKYKGETATNASIDISKDEWFVTLRTPHLARKFIETHTEQQIHSIITRLIPAESPFIITYASLLDKGYAQGLVGAAGVRDFAVLKWEFIFACALEGNGISFHQKFFVYSVLKQLAAHYNQNVIDLLHYFLYQIPAVVDAFPFKVLKSLLRELYDEHRTPLVNVSSIRFDSNEDLERWVLSLFGENAPFIASRESYLEKWLVYLLNERNESFRSLWKQGKLNNSLVLGFITRTPKLRQLWLRRVGDERLLVIYRNWMTVYKALRSRFSEFHFLDAMGEYLSVWMVELTAKPFLAWSEAEILKFLTNRLRRSAPAGFMALIDKIDFGKNKNITEIINNIDKLKEEEAIMSNTTEIAINNAGMVILSPYLPRLFKLLNLLKEDKQSFKDEASKVRAIFLLQYLTYGEQREYPETELALNKLLVGKENNTPLPRKLDLTQDEMKLTDSMLEMTKVQWDKMKGTSTQGIRETFFQREGFLCYRSNHAVWDVTIAEKTYDILMDSIPWGFKTIKYPWVEKIIKVNWR